MWTLWLLAFLPCSRAFSFPESLDLKLALNDMSLSSFSGGVACANNWNYLVPWKDNNGNYYGKLVRLTGDWTTVEVLDLPTHVGNADLVGFGGAVCAASSYLLLAPFHHGWAVRLSVTAWSTTLPHPNSFSTVDFTVTHPELTGFCSTFYWAGYAFFVPCTHGTVVRVNVNGWYVHGTLNLTAQNSAWRGFTGGAWSGSYGYVVPHGLHGESSGVVVGFELNDLSSGTVTIDVASTNPHLTGFVGGFLTANSGNSLMLVPHDYGEAVSVNLDSRTIITQWNLTASRSGLRGFAGGFADTSSGDAFLVPLRRKNGGYSSKVVRISGSGDIQVMDVAKDDPDLAGFNGGFIDGNYAFLVPFRDAWWPKNSYDAAYDSASAGKVVRFPLSTTTTSTLTLTVSTTTTTQTTTSQTLTLTSSTVSTSTSTHDPNCPLGWFQGDGIGGEEIVIGMVSSAAECSEMAAWKCPTAKGVTLQTDGVCKCEFDMEGRNGTAASSCFFSPPMNEDKCVGGWQDAKYDGDEIALWLNVASQEECLALCLARLATEQESSACMTHQSNVNVSSFSCFLHRYTAQYNGAVPGWRTCIIPCELGGQMKLMPNSWADCDGSSTYLNRGIATCSAGRRAECPLGTFYVRSAPPQIHDVCCCVTALFPFGSVVVTFGADGACGYASTLGYTITTTLTATSSTTTTSTWSATTTSSSTRSSSTSSSLTTSTSTSKSSTSSSSTSSSSTVSSTSSSTSTSSSSSSSVSSSSSSSTSATTSSSTSSSSSFSSTSTSSSTVSTSSTTSRTSSTSSTSVSSTTSSSSTTLSSTTSSTATTITETATTHTVTSTTTVTTMLIIPAAEKAMKAEKTIKEGAEKLVARSLPGMDTALGRLTIVAVADLLAEKEVPLANAMEKSGVQASREMLEELPAGSVIAMLNLPLPKDEEWRKQEPFDNVGGEKLALPVMGVTVLDDHFEPVTKFKEPLLIKLTEDPNATGADEAECAFLEVLSNTSVRWSTRGVRRATKAEAGGKEGVWCRAEHLSLFAVLLQVALGCTNLELLTPQAISAIETHEGWWRSPPAVLFFCVAAVLLTLVLLGSAVELWRMRLGQMKKPAKNVELCKSCLAFGPQLLKHRYAAFVVFAKDLLSCMAKGREKLRLPTLTAAVQRNFALEAAISNACVSQHCWSGGAWTESSAALPHSVLLHKLHYHAGGAEESIARLLRGKGPLHILRRYFITFAACHPLLDSLRLGANALTVRKRAALQVAAFLGVLATNAMIFNFSGSQRGWEADFSCPILPTSQLFIIVATVVSIILNVLPNTFLMNLAKQIHGRPAWHLVFWALTIFYLTLAAFIVVVALANLNPKDQVKWHSSMRWSLSIKLLGMPAVQALRNSILLELFLHEKGKVPPMEQLLGLAVPMEQPLSKEEHEIVDRVAARGLTAEGLVNFLSLLGDIVMPDFDMETSTSADVVEGALRSFCGRGPELAQASLDVKVSRLRGVRSKGDRRLQCAVLRLGSLERGGKRACLAESRSKDVMVNPDGECPFDLAESVTGLELTGAIGFVVMEKDRMIGAASLSAEELVKGRGFAGELPLHALDAAAENFTSLETPLVRANAADSGLKEERCKLAQTAKIAVRVVMLPEYMQALALHELRKRKLASPGHSSEVPEGSETLRREVLLQATRTKEKGSSCLQGACYGEEVGLGPVEEVVVHSQQMVFLDLVAAIVAENLGGNHSCDLREALLCREFDGLLDMLRASPRCAVRYWIDMFSLDVDCAEWKKELVRATPTLLRCVRRQCCSKMAENVRAKKDMSCGLPEQLVIFDQNLCILQEAACLAQVKVANDLRFAQRVLLRPEHLHGPKLGEKLLRTGSAETWARPHTNDRAALTGIFVALSLKEVERQREGNDTVEDLHLADVVAAVAGARAGQRTDLDDAAGDIGAADVAADIDA